MDKIHFMKYNFSWGTLKPKCGIREVYYSTGDKDKVTCPECLLNLIKKPSPKKGYPSYSNSFKGGRRPYKKKISHIKKALV